jgi:hypothetical protein
MNSPYAERPEGLSESSLPGEKTFGTVSNISNEKDFLNMG